MSEPKRMQTMLSNKLASVKFSSRFLSQTLQMVSALCLGLSVAGQAQAEKADSKKEAIIEAGHGTTDNKTNVSKLSHGVQLTRGTLKIVADNGTSSELSDSSIHTILYGVAGAQVHFKQKRDGGKDLWIEGWCDRAEYNEKTEMVKFISNAKVRYLEGSTVTKELSGEFLAYDSKEDVFVGTNSKSGTHQDGGGKIRIVISPRKEAGNE